MCNNSEESTEPPSKSSDVVLKRNRTKKSEPLFDESAESLLSYLAIESDVPVHTDYAPVRPASDYKYILHFTNKKVDKR